MKTFNREEDNEEAKEICKRMRDFQKSFITRF